MPIKFFDAQGTRTISQSFDSPTVYLDHWALRMFSDDRVLQDRFVLALLAKGGTLLLSIFSLAEFAASAESAHCDEAERFLERLFPNIYLTDFRMNDILVRERAEPNNRKRFWPTADLRELKRLATGWAPAEGAFSMHGFIRAVHD